MISSFLIPAMLAMVSPAMGELEPDLPEEEIDHDQVAIPLKQAPKYKSIDNKKHPDYVRCRRLQVVGSRRTERVCMKNREWRQYVTEQNRRTRGFADQRNPSGNFDQSEQLSVGGPDR